MRTVLSGLLLLLLRMALGQAGTVDPTFNTQMNAWPDSVDAVAYLPDGKILIGGTFTQVQGVPRNRIARLLGNGSLDTSFDPGLGADARVFRLLVQPDGMILLAGWFTSYGGVPRARLARITPNGALDPSFDAGSGPAGNQAAIYDWVLQPDGRVVVVGGFITINGISRPGVARLLSTGAVDQSFATGTGPNGVVVCVALQPDGKVLIGGTFSSVGSTPCHSLARLLPSGAVESTTTFDQSIGFFIANGGVLATIYDLSLQPDGSIIAAGAFDSYRGSSADCMVRIAQNGARDASFSGFDALGGYFVACEVQPDGKVIIVDSSGNIKRLRTDGSYDSTFTPYDSSLPIARNVVLQPDGKLLIWGPLTRLRGDATDALPVAVKVLLTGPYEEATGRMKDGLRTAGVIPLAQPYATGQVSGGTERRPPWVTATNGDNAVVDWVMVEVRDQPTHVLMTRNGLVQRDGDVVGVDGTSPLYFLAPPGNYHIAVRHRNHLGVMSATAIPLSTTLTTVDFTLPTTTTYGTGAQNQIGARMVLWAGNTTTDNMVKYTGSANDRDVVLTAVGSTTPNNTVSNAYSRSDTNMDGAIKYTGSGNDRDIILLNVGSTTPNNTRTQQLP